MAVFVCVCVCVLALRQSVEGEGHDRYNITLPGFQEQLINEVAAAAKGPVIVVVSRLLASKYASVRGGGDVVCVHVCACVLLASAALHTKCLA